MSVHFPTTLHSFECVDNFKYRTGKATDEEHETCFEIMHQNLIGRIAERQEKLNLEHSVSGQKIGLPKHRLGVIPKADETRAVVICCWITPYVHTYLRHGSGLASLHFVRICGVEKGRSRKLGWHIKEGKKDDNKKRVMVPGNAKRVVTSRIEEKKNSCRRTGPDDDIQDVRSEDGTGSGLPYLLLSFSSYFLLC